MVLDATGSLFHLFGGFLLAALQAGSHRRLPDDHGDLRGGGSTYASASVAWKVKL